MADVDGCDLVLTPAINGEERFFAPQEWGA